MASLILMRHAKSDWNTEAPTDFERPLNGRGRRNAATMANWIARELPRPDVIVSSPSERTRQTLFAVCASIAYPPSSIRWENDIYDASLPALLGVLQTLPDAAETVMLVGHSPGMEMLATHLSGADIPVGDGEKAFPTAAVAHLETQVPWHLISGGCATLVGLTRPRDLESPGTG